ncbi:MULTISPECIES: GspH/FimT family pseudopilin [Pseudomonadaceae]|uniref:GspH/FimT family pseudopilin n=1 Tax=Pseudomonadaceae TaxID=135621 RepID=UPI0013649144|nr:MULTISPECIES: GspH/FimT family pseudopilin [Pseudomonas]MBO2929634.1 GspH/FimT family pseudopilin [Pseudomonas otitidis]
MRGFTLTELLAVTVLVFLLGAGCVVVFHWFAGVRMSIAADDYVAGIRLARELAVVRGNRYCWTQVEDKSSQGWMVAEGGEKVIMESKSNFNKKMQVRNTRTLVAGVCFDSTGVALMPNGAFQAGSIYLCDHMGKGVRITVNRGGRVRRSFGLTELEGCNSL